MKNNNIELKKKQWKIAKKEWIKNIPKKYKIEIDGLNSNQKYYHPIITLDDDISIKGQGDTESNSIYGEKVLLNKKLINGGFLYEISIDVNSLEQLEYLVNNFDKIKDKLNKRFCEIEKIHIFRNNLKVLQENIIYNSIQKHIDIPKTNKSIKDMYEITEFLENERLNV